MEQVDLKNKDFDFWIDLYQQFRTNAKKVKPIWLTIDRMDDLLDNLDLNFKEFDFKVYNTDKSFTYIYHIDDQKYAEIIVSAIDQFFGSEEAGELLGKENMVKFELKIDSTFGNPYGFYYTDAVYRLIL